MLSADLLLISTDTETHLCSATFGTYYCTAIYAVYILTSKTCLMFICQNVQYMQREHTASHNAMHSTSHCISRLAWFEFCNFCILSHFGCRSFACTSVRRSVFDFTQGHTHVFTWVKLTQRSVHSQKCKVIWIHLANVLLLTNSTWSSLRNSRLQKPCDLWIWHIDKTRDW